VGMTRRQFLTTISAAAAGSATLTSSPRRACGQPRPGVPADPLKIGVLAAASGVTAPVGQAGLRAVQWWAERANAAGGVLGRKVELVVEEESSPTDTVERFRKLALQAKVEMITGGVSTAVGLALGPVAEELQMLWLAWDSTTQKGVEETMPKTRYAFRSVDNEAEAIGGAIMTAKHFKDVKTIAGINNDYSYGRDCWDAFQAVLKRYGPSVRPVLDLWPKLGATDFTSHIAAIQRAAPDLLMSSFWSGDATIFMKQAAAVNLFAKMKGCFTTAGGVHDSLKKSFTPEGLILGYNSMYFDHPKASPLLKAFVKEYHTKYKEYPPYEADHAYFTVAVYRAAVEKAYAAAQKWPTGEQVAAALPNLPVESLSSMRSYREDHIMTCNFYQGITTHKNPYDFVTIDPIEELPTARIQKPAGTKLYDWIAKMQL
jgi:branched-chain amino acid transport system substrate-binding protein